MIRRWWKGEERLVIVYWEQPGDLGSVSHRGRSDRQRTSGHDFHSEHGLDLRVYAFCAFSIWQCAFNVKHRIWGYLARTQVVLGIVSTVGLLLKEAP